MTDEANTPEMDDAEIERRYAEIQQRKAQEAADARAAEIAPIKALVEDEAFATIHAAIAGLRETIGINSPSFSHLNAAYIGMEGLKVTAAA